MMDTTRSAPHHPFFQLLYLVLFSMLGAVVFTILSFAFYFVFFKPDQGGAVYWGEMKDVNFLRCIQMGSSIGLFIAGPLAFAWFERYRLAGYYYTNERLKGQLLLLVITTMIFGMPLLELVASFNQNMSLPESLKGLEHWMRIKEDEAEVLTKTLLRMKGYGDLLINLVMVALIPAIGEELMFRGALMNILKQWTKNIHIAIWVSAILFSAIHVQFFGFIPRMLLGALFGYLLYWSNHIGYAILAHFVNNATAVIVAFVWQMQGKGLEQIDQNDSFNLAGYVFSTIITITLLFKFYQETRKVNLSVDE